MDGYRGLVDEVVEAEEAVQEPDFAEAWPTFADDLLATESAKQVFSTLAQLDKRGYDVG